MFKKILLGLLIIFVLAQFIRPSTNKGNADAATDIMHTVTVPDTVAGLLRTACYDCHSDHTKYPWYSQITPVNWWLKNHIDEGKKHLNFTTFSKYSYKRQDKKLDEVAKTVEEHEMPLDSYLWIHKEAKLNDAQRKTIIDWANAARKEVMQDSMDHVKPISFRN